MCRVIVRRRRRRRRRRGITTRERFCPHDVCSLRAPSAESARARAACVIRARYRPPGRQQRGPLAHRPGKMIATDFPRRLSAATDGSRQRPLSQPAADDGSSVSPRSATISYTSPASSQITPVVLLFARQEMKPK